jgi:hypothetical protein
MIGVEKIGEIRRAYFEQHRSIKEIGADVVLGSYHGPQLRLGAVGRRGSRTAGFEAGLRA